MNSRERLKELIADMYRNGGEGNDEEISGLIHELAVSPAFEDISDLYSQVVNEMREDPRYRDIVAERDMIGSILMDKWWNKRDN